MQSVFEFRPLFKERPWGGHRIESIGTGRHLPPNRKIGESWEVVDREEDESVIQNGEFADKTIRWLLGEHGTRVMGRPWKKGERFPLLIKILDAAERLSLQVHPPAAIAAELKGEPKTEMWYQLEAAPGAAVMAGLKKGVSRGAFESALNQQQLEPLIHRIPFQTGDSIFIPSGRIHAIDAGCLILEIQQNSDTTYRVYDWGRVGLDGKPRQLHVQETLASTDFQDFEPPAQSSVPHQTPPEGVVLASCESFEVRRYACSREFQCEGKPSVIYLKEGELTIRDTEGICSVLRPGQIVLITAEKHVLIPGAKSEWIRSTC